MAMESEYVTADMVEASEFPELSDRFQVYAVPLTVVNQRTRIEGGLPEPLFVSQILNSVGVAASLSQN
jgi:hypothetical protein